MSRMIMYILYIFIYMNNCKKNTAKLKIWRKIKTVIKYLEKLKKAMRNIQIMLFSIAPKKSKISPQTMTLIV
jgi:hypothetical protein